MVFISFQEVYTVIYTVPYACNIKKATNKGWDCGHVNTVQYTPSLSAGKHLGLQTNKSPFNTSSLTAH